mgnify:CR=1 FL=1
MAYRLTDIPYKAEIADDRGFLSRMWDDFFLRIYEVIGANNTNLFSNNFARISKTNQRPDYTVTLKHTLVLHDFSVTNISEEPATLTVKINGATEIDSLSIPSGGYQNLTESLPSRIFTQGTSILINSDSANALIIKGDGREVKTS